MTVLGLSFAMLWREWRAGEFRVLALALVIAVAAITAVGFFTDRVERALTLQANQMLGADLVVASDHPLPPVFAAQAGRFGLRMAQTLSFPSMVLYGGRNQLAEIKAVSAGYPLHGSLRISAAAFAPDRTTSEIPAVGAAWLDTRLMQQLELKVGDRIELGGTRLTVAAVLTREPDRGGNLFSIAPRLMMNMADVQASGLIQTGSLVFYRMLLAGDAKSISAFRNWAAPRLERGMKLEGVADARPEVRALLDRARQFLGLAAMVSVVVAAVAVVMAARQFMRRHLDYCAMLRCLGAAQAAITGLFLFQFLWLGLAASLTGCVAGYAAQHVLAGKLGSLLVADLPPPSLWPLLQGLLTGLVTLLGFSFSSLLQLRKVPTLRVLRHELGAPPRSSLLGFGLGLAMLSGLLLWQARDYELGFYVLGGLAGMMLAAALLALLAIRLLAGFGGGPGAGWRYGIGSLLRRRASTLAQVTAFSLGLMVLLLLTLVRGDLMTGWRTSLPPDAPNRFLINIQPDQLAALRSFFVRRQIAVPEFFAIVRGRLTAINGRPVSAADYPDEHAKRLVEREFNLSWAERLQQDNRIVAGRWWDASDRGKAALSVEEGVANTLGFGLGDTLSYSIAGDVLSARIVSVRKVEWDSFRPNFFVLAVPGLLDKYPASYMTSFYLPAGAEPVLDEMVKNFPNVTVIDVAAVMNQVREITDRVAGAAEFVFLFSVLAGMMVLYAAISATRDERIYETAMLRILGANRGQLVAGQASEFAVLGALSGLLAAAGASTVGYLLSKHVLHLPYLFDPWLWLAGLLLGAGVVTLAGLSGVHGILRRPPLLALRRLA